jgi:hypothetical protein
MESNDDRACKLAVTKTDMAGGNYYYFSWRRAIIGKERATRIINRNNQLRFGEIRSDAIPTVYFGEGIPYKKGSVRQIAVKKLQRITIFLTN